MVAAKQQTRLIPVATCSVSAIDLGEGQFEFAGSGEAKSLDGLILDLSRPSVEFRGITAQNSERLYPKADALIQLDGYSWQYSRGKDISDYTALRVTIGRIQDTDRVYLEFDCTESVAERVLFRDHQYVDWELTSSSTH